LLFRGRQQFANAQVLSESWLFLRRYFITAVGFKGRVQVLSPSRDTVTQATDAIAEFNRLAALAPTWAWARTAVQTNALYKRE
jgi:hypothetical protein